MTQYVFAPCGALHGHRVILIAMHHGRLRAWAVLHASVDPRRKRPRMDTAAAARGLHGEVLGHFKCQSRQIKDLACFAHTGHGQLALTALGTAGGRCE